MLVNLYCVYITLCTCTLVFEGGKGVAVQRTKGGGGRGEGGGGGGEGGGRGGGREGRRGEGGGGRGKE